MPLLAQIPSAVYGFASVAAYTLLAGKLGTLTSASIVDNPLINIIVSMVIGALLGWLSEKIAGALVARQATRVGPSLRPGIACPRHGAGGQCRGKTTAGKQQVVTCGVPDLCARQLNQSAKVMKPAPPNWLCRAHHSSLVSIGPRSM